MAKELDASALRAKRILLGMFVVWFIGEALVIAINGKVTGGVRYILTLLLMYYVFQGRLWARNLMAGLCCVGAALVLVIGISNFNGMGIGPIVIIVAAGFFLAIAAYLLLSKNLNRYFAWQRFVYSSLDLTIPAKGKGSRDEDFSDLKP